MARAALITEQDSDNDGDLVAPGPENANGLANIGDMAPGTDSRPERQRQAEPSYEIIDADDNLRPITERRSEDERLDDENAGDGTLLEQRRREADRAGGGREDRAERRRRQKEGRDRTLSENATLRARIAMLEQQVNGFEPRMSEFDQSRIQQQVSEIDRQIAGGQERMDRAYTEMAEAQISGDAAGFRKAMETRDQTMIAMQQLAVRKNMLTTGNPLGEGGTRQPATQPQQGRTAPAPQSREVQSRVQDFVETHPWYNTRDLLPDGTPVDQDTAVMLVIDRAVARDGFDPTTDDYWDEIEERARQYLPHRFGSARQAQSQPTQRERQQDQSVRQQPPAPRRGPPVGGAPDRAPAEGGRRVLLSPGRKDALIAAGALARDGKTVEDSSKFKRLLAQYERYDRENGVSA